jgi:hypothetical protein
MPCNKPNCCRKAKAVETELRMKATAELSEEIDKEISAEDKPLKELLDEDTDTSPSV